MSGLKALMSHHNPPTSNRSDESVVFGRVVSGVVGDGLRLRLGMSLVVCCLLGVSLAGCAGYRFGNSCQFRADVSSVHVPIIEADSFRRHLGQRLTDAVIREIQSRTPYKIRDAATADTILRAKLVRESKHVLGETQFDDPRELQINFTLEVTWNTIDGTPLMQRLNLKIDESQSFVPEGGQSLVTAQQEMINDLARQVVNQMEATW